MPRTFQDLRDVARHAAGGALDPRVTPDSLVNDAGQYLVTLHDWPFLERSSVLLDLVGGQDHINLPPGLTQIDALEVVTTVTTSLVQTTLAVINRLRSDELTSPGAYHWAVEWPGQYVSTEAVPGPRLALWPTPADDEAEAFRLTWSGGWRTLTQPDEVHTLPPAMEILLVEVIREMTIGRTMELKGGPPAFARLDGIENSAVLRNLKRSFGRVQGNLGQAEGGALDSRRRQPVLRRFQRIARA